ncbi:MAG: ammonium transporter [Proteobacteria bacterium]|nr:ammonium transporter [Pseudomonadota bacterium]MBI3498710.1 ammonium transporter [Pseudomonadota bacterium]
MTTKHGKTLGLAALLWAAAPVSAFAADPPKIDSGDTAWMLTSVALVLMMTIPGLALFYGGMVRKKNVLDTVMQSFAITCLVTILWMIVNYSAAFTAGTPFLGGFSRAFLQGVASDIAANSKSVPSVNSLAPTIPEMVYMCFQLTFAIITPALICGAFAERMKFSAMLWFMALWATLVYAPIAHWVWGPDGIFNSGNDAAWVHVLDFAGGTVVHVNAGVAGLVTALVLGKRKGLGTENMAPHNLVYTMIGASLLWVGWFGFNAGSATSAGLQAGMAMTVTQIATAAAGLSWMFAEWAIKGKPSLLGICSGAVAGLVAITPASGFVGPFGALVIGTVAGLVCYWGAVSLKSMFGYDDALDAFGVHAVGGAAGALLTGVFAINEYGGTSGLIEGNGVQVLYQAIGIVTVVVYDAIATLIILKVIDAVIGLRVDLDVERDGLDLNLHGEVVP